MINIWTFFDNKSLHTWTYLLNNCSIHHLYRLTTPKEQHHLLHLNAFVYVYACTRPVVINHVQLCPVTDSGFQNSMNMKVFPLNQYSFELNIIISPCVRSARLTVLSGGMQGIFWHDTELGDLDTLGVLTSLEKPENSISEKLSFIVANFFNLPAAIWWTKQGFFEGFSVLGRDEVVNYWIDGGVEIQKDSSDVHQVLIGDVVIFLWYPVETR